MRNGMKKKILALTMTAAVAAGMLTGCGGSTSDSAELSEAGNTVNTAGEGEKVLRFGCQNYGDGLVDPANQTNAAWNCMRYGIGEALFKFNDSMETEGWLADSCEVSDDHLTWTIHLKDGIKFSD